MRASSVFAGVLILLTFGSLAQAQTASSPASCALRHEPGVSDQQLQSGQRPRTYRIFVPPAYDGRTALPLVLDLHGSGGTSEQQARSSGMETVAAREGFAVASLQVELPH